MAGCCGLGTILVGMETVVVAVGDQGRPLGVDVELHRADRAGALEDLRQRGHGLVVGGGVDQVAVTVDADTGSPDADGVPERVPPLRAVVQRRVELSVLDDQRQALAGEGDLRPGVRPTASRTDVDAAVAVADQRRQTVLERLVGAAVDREPLWPSM